MSYTTPDIVGLSELLSTAAIVAGLSARKISTLARQAGHTLSPDTAARYLRGAHGTPSEATLAALAHDLDIPLLTLRAAADLPTGTADPYVPPRQAARLTQRQRRAVDEVIRAMLTPAPRHSES